MGKELRIYPRIAINAFVRFYEESVDSATQEYLQGVVKNYSDGGMLISTNHPLPKGSVATLEIPIESGPQDLKIVQVLGTVRWVQDLSGRQGMGIEFFEFKESEHKDFSDWLLKLIE